MNSKIKFIALSVLASAMTFTSVASQAAVDGSVDVKFQSSITSAYCDVALFDENKTKIDSNTLVVPSLTNSEAGVSGALGKPTQFYIGPNDDTMCDWFKMDDNRVSVSVSGTSTDTNGEVLTNTNSSGPQNIGFFITDEDSRPVLNSDPHDYPYTETIKYIPYEVSLFNVDGSAAAGGLVSSVAVFTTAYM
ncbi:type 1 fimbrial protein [Vibrio campbellii]|uniref:fimbrial protein n=1 Tax=Vibrio campbellii TaxID=680 RepID=UPI00210D2BD5|nr:hypothetical protein [Vibrio campbellii]UTZ38758.1 type 1 fimbrial protein [Vibrio campbellii]